MEIQTYLQALAAGYAIAIVICILAMLLSFIPAALQSRLKKMKGIPG